MFFVALLQPKTKWSIVKANKENAGSLRTQSSESNVSTLNKQTNKKFKQGKAKMTRIQNQPQNQNFQTVL